MTNERMSVGSAHLDDELPDYLREALRTDEVGGFKLFENVLEEATIQHPGADKPVVRQAIESYIERQLIGRSASGSKIFLKDNTCCLPPRVTEIQYKNFRVIRRYLLPMAFRRLPTTEIMPLLEGTSNAFAWIAVYRDLGLIEVNDHEAGLNTYRLSSNVPMIAVYPKGKYTGGRLIDLTKPDDPELPELIARNHTGRTGQLGIFARMNAVIEGLLQRQAQQHEVSCKLDELRSVLERGNTQPNTIEALLEPIRSTCAPGDVTAEEIRILRLSLPYWQKYLADKEEWS